MLRTKIIELKVKLFINNLNLGEGIALPKELSMTPYPDSFRFYDPVLSIMQRFCQDSTRTIFRMKKQMTVKNMIEKDLGYNFMQKAGV